MVYNYMQLKCGVDLAEVWKMEDNGINSTPSAGNLILNATDHRELY
jgi:hypothetical protein